MASSVQNLSNQNVAISWIQFLTYPFRVLLSRMYAQLHFLEQFYIKLYNIYAFVSQMLFFTVCALCFNEHKEGEKAEEYFLVALKTLLFYSVFTYFVTKTRDILSPDHRPSLFQNWSMTEGFCRIIIEWAKAIIVVICLREQGIQFKPSFPYAFITFTYYMSTEKIFSEILLKSFQYFAFDLFEDMEHLYVPMILNVYTIILSLSITSYCFLTAQFLKFASVHAYFTIYIRVKDVYYNYWRILQLEKEIFDNFRQANQKELDEHDDICAVCLSAMSKAKITPCNHFFHPNCLKECLKSSFSCPICKFNF